MKRGQDITAEFPGIFIIHQKIPGREVDKHAHDEHELFFPLQGEILVEAVQKCLKAGPGKMIYLPPGTAHSFRSSSEGQGERLILIVKDRAWRTNEGGRFEPAVVSVSQLAKELLFHLLLHPKTRAAKALTATLVQTVSEMLEEGPLHDERTLVHLQGRSGDGRLQKAIELVEAEFASSLSMERLARASGLSVRNLNRLFLKELGMTPKQAVTLFRIERAKKLLAQGGTTVTDVAFEVGYASVSQFITTFRKVTGRLPSEWSTR